MENTLYYTFSTIAQVLAAIVGIIGAFAIFRFHSYKESLLGLTYNFIQRASGTELNKSIHYQYSGKFL
jgi:hypothetical protein